MSKHLKRKTYFADPTRATAQEIKKTLRVIEKDPIIHTILESLNGFVLILNRERQILAANQELLDGLKRKSPECMLGLRPGELFNCINFTKGPGGCGTAENCRHCGAVLSILAAQTKKKPIKDECRLTVLKNGKLQAMEFAVKVSPLVVQDSELLIFSLNDISPIKRKDTLQSLFSHDYMNILTGLEGWTELLKEKRPMDAAKEIMTLITRLKTDFQFYNQLYLAENNHLHLDWTQFKLNELLDELFLLIRNHKNMENKQFRISASGADEISIQSDRSLLLRVLLNMVKNACENTPDQQMITMEIVSACDWLVFKVKNPVFIPRKIQGQIFQRTFTTKKEVGHGLGTFSMKLFGESYLKGRVSFVSDKKDGTVFVFELPLLSSGVDTAHRLDSEDESHDKSLLNVIKKSKKTENKLQIESAIAAQAKPASTGQKRIVLIEDEPQLLKLGKLLLEGLDYWVMAFSDPMAALAYLLKSDQAPDLIITDNNMPGINGLELAEKILKKKPNSKILLTTGLFEEGLENECQRIGILDVLSKPFDLNTLSLKIANIWKH